MYTTIQNDLRIDFMEDIIGKIIGIFRVEYLCDFKDNNANVYHVKCTKCGYETDMRKNNIKTVKQCTHTNIIGMNKKLIKSSFTNNRLHKIFTNMIERCYNQKNKDYQWYGEKGVRVCGEWLNSPIAFNEWAMNNGYNDNSTIDRIESDKNYCPDNCRWISAEDNARYKSTTSLISVDGEIHTGKDWAKILGLGCNRINTYIRQYGLNNTIEFIKRFRKNPPSNIVKNQRYYKLYMEE